MWHRISKWHGVVAFGLMVVVAVMISMKARRDLREEIYLVCLGKAGTGHLVTTAEKARCACKAAAALGAVPVKSRLPRWLAGLDRDDRARMLDAQAICRKA